jgi:hypothetical protein
MWMKGFLFSMESWSKFRAVGSPTDSKISKEARMKSVIRINYIFWKEGPLLFDVAQSKLPRLLTCKYPSTRDVE